MKNFIITVSILIILLTAGCVRSLEHAQEVLLNHPKGEVRYPAEVGGAVGAIVSVPVTLVLIPVMIPLAYCLSPFAKTREDAEYLMWLPTYPMFYCTSTGAITGGGIPYLLFGWWGVDKPVAATENQLSDK